MVFGIIAGVGWLVYNAQSTDKTVSDNSAAKTSEAAMPSTACATSNDWTTITTQDVTLPDFGVKLTLDRDAVNKAVCRFENGYEFSTLAVVNDKQCVDYYAQKELLLPGLEIGKYASNTNVASIMYGQSGTLGDFYTKNKAADGEYVADPSLGNKFYKVGDTFFTAFGDTEKYLADHRSDREAACKNAPPDFRQQFVDAMASIRKI